MQCRLELTHTHTSWQNGGGGLRVTGGGTATLIDSNIYDNNEGLRIEGKKGVYNYYNYDNNGNPEWLTIPLAQ